MRDRVDMLPSTLHIHSLWQSNPTTHPLLFKRLPPIRATTTCGFFVLLYHCPLCSVQNEMAAQKTLFWIKCRANSIMLSMCVSQKSIYFMRTHAGFNVSIPALPSHVPLWAARGRSFNSPERVWERMDPQRTSNCAKKTDLYYLWRNK